jgi:hypothetical protein
MFVKEGDIASLELQVFTQILKRGDHMIGAMRVEQAFGIHVRGQQSISLASRR